MNRTRIWHRIAFRPFMLALAIAICLGSKPAFSWDPGIESR